MIISNGSMTQIRPGCLLGKLSWDITGTITDQKLNLSRTDLLDSQTKGYTGAGIKTRNLSLK
jgi:hypothetical protein